MGLACTEVGPWRRRFGHRRECPYIMRRWLSVRAPAGAQTWAPAAGRFKADAKQSELPRAAAAPTSPPLDRDDFSSNRHLDL